LFAEQQGRGLKSRRGRHTGGTRLS
jgi:hypothetical protein